MGYFRDVRYDHSFLVVFLTFCVLLATWGCSGGSQGKQARGPKSVPVVVGTVTTRDVPLQLRTMGNVQALTTVAVKPLVGGEIIGVHFVEGQEVRKGDLLFTIDPRPYDASVKQSEANLAKDLAQVKQAEANLERDSAQAKNAGVQAERYRTLAERNLVSRELYDQVRTNSEALESTLAADRAALENAKSAVQADRASLENAKLQLAYCSIRSPLSGRTGSILVHRGNVVKANDTQSLTVINQISPVYVVFSLPEKALSDIRRHMAIGRLKVEASLPNDTKAADEGVLTFVDNAVDNSTGTIQLKGTFPNQAQRLWPGQFVNTTLTLTTQRNAVVISNKAIQTGQQGQYVFVVKQDSTVESRPIVVDRVMDEDAVITKGLNPGETVVLDGQLQLIPGVKVVIKQPASNGNNRKRPA
jgi:membrane fusion protein, multidrug efflux system